MGRYLLDVPLWAMKKGCQRSRIGHLQTSYMSTLQGHIHNCTCTTPFHTGYEGENFEPASKYLTLISSVWWTLQLHCKAMAIRRSRACENGGRAWWMIARSNIVLENESACAHINEDTHDQAGHWVSGGDGIRGLSDWWCDQSGYALGLLYNVSLKDPWHHYLKVELLISATTWRALMENASPLF